MNVQQKMANGDEGLLPVTLATDQIGGKRGDLLKLVSAPVYLVCQRVGGPRALSEMTNSPTRGLDHSPPTVLGGSLNRTQDNNCLLRIQQLSQSSMPDDIKAIQVKDIW